MGGLFGAVGNPVGVAQDILLGLAVMCFLMRKAPAQNARA